MASASAKTNGGDGQVYALMTWPPYSASRLVSLHSIYSMTTIYSISVLASKFFFQSCIHLIFIFAFFFLSYYIPLGIYSYGGNGMTGNQKRCTKPFTCSPFYAPFFSSRSLKSTFLRICPSLSLFFQICFCYFHGNINISLLIASLSRFHFYHQPSIVALPAIHLHNFFVSLLFSYFTHQLLNVISSILTSTFVSCCFYFSISSLDERLVLLVSFPPLYFYPLFYSCRSSPAVSLG